MGEVGESVDVLCLAPTLTKLLIGYEISAAYSAKQGVSASPHTLRNESKARRTSESAKPKGSYVYGCGVCYTKAIPMYADVGREGGRANAVSLSSCRHSLLQ